MRFIADVLKSAVAKCKASELESLVRQWGYLKYVELDQIDFSKSKRCVYREILRLCDEKHKQKETADRVNEFDLMCSVKYSFKKRWSMYKLSDKKTGTLKENELSDPKKFKKKLLQQIELYFDSTAAVSVTLHDGALWCRLYIQSGAPARFMNSNTIYLVYYPHCPCFAITAFKVSVRNFLFQCLSNAFNHHSLTNMMLSGLHYKSLFQLAFNKIGESSFGRLKAIENLPFLCRNERKRKAKEMEREPNLRSEDEVMKRRRSQSLEASFGVYDQPVLESLQFKVEVKFRGSQNLVNFPVKDEPFRCRVKFEGPSVLDGVRNLASCGLANEPLPKHLMRVNSLGTNYFVLRNKDKT